MASPLSKGHDNPFYLPIGLTGIGKLGLSLCALKITLLGLATIGAVAIISRALGWTEISPLTLLSDTTFMFIKQPKALLRVLSDTWDSKGGILLMLIGLVAFVFAANPQLTKAAELMTRNLSIGDKFPFTEWKARRASIPLSVMLIGSLLGGISAWFGLLQPDDSVILRVFRLLAIGFLVQFLCMLVGGAMACSQAEGKYGFPALGRLISLAMQEKGHFMRAAVYTLPRWLGVSFFGWLIFVTTILTPFFLGDILLPFWLAFLGPVNSSALRIGRFVLLAVTGIFLLILWGALIRERKELVLRFICSLGFGATIWCFFILPFMGTTTAHNSFGFEATLNYFLGRTGYNFQWQTTACLVLVGLIVILITATILGTLLLLYPLAAGICTFFSLRQGAEGKDYHSAATISQASAQAFIATPGSVLFGSGGASVLKMFSPPRGWLSLAWVGFTPLSLILISLGVVFLSCSIKVVSNFTSNWKYFLWIACAACSFSFSLPLACRNIAQSLTGKRPNRPMLPNSLLPWRMVMAWLIIFSITILGTLLLCIGGTIELIPWVGPILWGIFYPALLLCAYGFIVMPIVQWIPGSLILPAVVATDIGPKGRATDVLLQTQYYTKTAPWTFIGTMAAGLPFALMSAFLAVIILILLELNSASIQGQRWLEALQFIFSASAYKSRMLWPLLSIWVVLTLILTGGVTALTNAYMIIRQTTGDRPMMVGDLVRLGRHTTINGDDNWDSAMDEYVGTEARITAFIGQDTSGSEVVRINVDEGQFAWRVINLTRLG
jgi:hypothetical protein